MNCYQSRLPQAWQYPVYTKQQMGYNSYWCRLYFASIISVQLWGDGWDSVDWSRFLFVNEIQQIQTCALVSLQPPLRFLSVVPKAWRWHLGAERIDPSAGGQCKARVVPTVIYKVPLLAHWEGGAAFCSSGSLRYGEISVVDHTHRKSHPQSHWVMSTFCCPGAFHTHNDQTQLLRQLAALCSYVSTHSEARRWALLSLLLKEALTFLHHPLLTLFHFYLAFASPRLPQFLICLSFSLPLKPCPL